jgi:DNA polymerase III delta prime subunit
MSTKKAIRERIRALERLGFTAIRAEHRRRHYLFIVQAPHGEVRLLVPASAGDWRSAINFVAAAKRAYCGITSTKNGRTRRSAR